MGTFNDFKHPFTLICPIHEGRIMANTLKYFLEKIMLKRVCETINRDGNQFTMFIRTYGNGEFMIGEKHLIRKVFTESILAAVLTVSH